MRHALLVVGLVLLVSGSAVAEIPQVMGYQGMITDNGGIPVSDDTYTVRFEIYDAETGGSLLWISWDMSVTTTGGVFSVMLGESPQPALNLDFDQDYWLSVIFEGEYQVPRKRLGSVGYAYMASGLVPGTEVIGEVSTGTRAAIAGTNTSTAAGSYGVVGAIEATAGTAVVGVSLATAGTTNGVAGSIHSESGSGVSGMAYAATGPTSGVYGTSASTDGRGVCGFASALAGSAWGVYGTSSSSSGRGVYGWATATTGTTFGVYGEAGSADGCGVYGKAATTTGTARGGMFRSSSPMGSGVFGETTSTVGVNSGVWGQTYSTAGRGVRGEAVGTDGSAIGVYGGSESTSGTGVCGNASATTGLSYGGRFVCASPSGHGVYGVANATTGTTYGVKGRAGSPQGYGLYADNTAGGWAGGFGGDVRIDGDLAVGTASPDYKLDVRGNRIQLKEDGTGHWMAMRTDGGGLDLQYEGANLYVQSTTDGEHILLNPNRDSNVGIGLTNPNRRLYVKHDVNGLSYPLKVENKDASPDTAAVGILFSAGGSGSNERGKGALAYRYTSTWNRGDFHFLQDTGENSDNPELSDAVMTIKNDGMVGIGTTSPENALLHVKVPPVVGPPIACKFESMSDPVVYVKSTSPHVGDGGIYVAAEPVIGYGVHADVGYADAYLCRYYDGVWSTSVSGYAGNFVGDVRVTGTLSKGAGSFVIDHPLDPENRLLRHNFVESPENLLLYRGKVRLDARGEAVVQMPDYFKALATEDQATVNLTPVGKSRQPARYEWSYEWAPDYDSFHAYGEPHREVAWMVMADRDDPVMRQLARPVEEEKGPDSKMCDKGKLLYPIAYDYPETMGRDYEALPEAKESSREERVDPIQRRAGGEVTAPGS